VVVVFIHGLPVVNKEMYSKPDSFGESIYYVITKLISHDIGSIAVPCFFLISGFYFFYKNDDWSFCFYKEQLRKRTKTLLIPYLIWNLLYIIVCLFKNYIVYHFGGKYDDAYFVIQKNSWIDLMWAIPDGYYPYNFPLWYLRDLMCMILLSPIFYFIFKYAKVYALILLTIVYLLGIEIPFAGLSSTAILYFGFGIFFGLKKNLLSVIDKFGRAANYLFFVLFIVVVCLRFQGYIYIDYFVRPLVILGVISAINLVDLVATNNKIYNILAYLSETVFFIYALHAIYVVNWVRGLFSRLPISNNWCGLILSYFLIVLVCISICISIFYILRRVCPRVLSLSIGGRIKLNNE
jgi:surface polysaccharide O-acyltransferase-like enzyme